MNIKVQFEQQLQQAIPGVRVMERGGSLCLIRREGGDEDEYLLFAGRPEERNTWMQERLIPEVSKLVEAFPTLEALPCPAPPLEDLPAEFRTGQHLACQAAERMMFYGTLKDFELRPRLPLTQAQGDQVITLVCAHLGCFGYRHEHKVAWVGTLLDRWFKVSRGGEDGVDEGSRNG